MLLAVSILVTCAAQELEDPAAVARSLPAPTLERSDLQRWRGHLRPAGRDAAFEEIPWIPDFAEGIRRADEAGRPLLFWAMNGHPLGCT